MAMIMNPEFGAGDLKNMNLLSPLEMLATVAERVYEYEHKFKPTVDIPSFKKKPLLFNLNVKPRTYGRPRSSPIDVDALLPCLHQKRKLEQRDGDINDSGELGFTRNAKKMKLTIRLQPPELLSEYKDKITELGGSDLRFVIQKKLRKSDVSNKKDCLKMPSIKCWVDFGEIEGMRVKVYYQPSNDFRETIMTFTRSCAESSYVFTGSWNDIVEGNHLMKGDTVQADSPV